MACAWVILEGWLSSLYEEVRNDLEMGSGRNDSLRYGDDGAWLRHLLFEELPWLRNPLAHGVLLRPLQGRAEQGGGGVAPPGPFASTPRRPLLKNSHLISLHAIQEDGDLRGRKSNRVRRSFVLLYFSIWN
ncbi:unnamed protein product [Victoria cruziana]